MKRISKIGITIILILSIIISCGSVIISRAVESELTLTPKPETNNIHLKWTGPQNSSYKVYQKKPGSSTFETIGLTDFNSLDEEVKVLNIYPTSNNNNPVLSAGTPIPNVKITYLDGQTEVVPKSAILKVWMEGRNCYRRINCNKF